MNNFSEAENTEIAVIPKGTVINGNIDIDGKLEMHGEINGNINSNDRVNIWGAVTGDIKAHDLYTKDSFIEGRIECVQSAVVCDNTVILGDIYADSLVLDGAIQGMLDVKGCITVGDKAIVDSDIKAKVIQVSSGAAINGHCSLCYAEQNMNDIFPETELKSETVEAAEATETVEAAEATETVEAAEATEIVEVAEAMETAETAEDAEAIEDADKPNQSAKPKAVAKKYKKIKNKKG